MFVGVLQITLVIPEARSLKAKRAVVRSVVDRTRARYRVAVAEVDDNDVHQRAMIGVSAVGNDHSHVNAILDKVLDAIEDQVIGAAELSDVQLEILNVSFDHR